MLLTLAACGGDPQASDPGNSSQPTASTSGDNGEISGDITYPKLNIRLAHDAPLTTPHHEACENIKAALEERSGGNITVTIYPNQQLGSASAMIESPCR